MSSTSATRSHSSHPKRDIKGHLYKIGQRVQRRQSNGSNLRFGKPRRGEIVDLTWKANKAGSQYPTYAVRFDNSAVIDKYVLQMRLIPLN